MMRLNLIKNVLNRLKGFSGLKKRGGTRDYYESLTALLRFFVEFHKSRIEDLESPFPFACDPENTLTPLSLNSAFERHLTNSNTSAFKPTFEIMHAVQRSCKDSLKLFFELIEKSGSSEITSPFFDSSLEKLYQRTRDLAQKYSKVLKFDPYSKNRPLISIIEGGLDTGIEVTLQLCVFNATLPKPDARDLPRLVASVDLEHLRDVRSMMGLDIDFTAIRLGIEPDLPCYDLFDPNGYLDLSKLKKFGMGHKETIGCPISRLVSQCYKPLLTSKQLEPNLIALNWLDQQMQIQVQHLLSWYRNLDGKKRNYLSPQQNYLLGGYASKDRLSNGTYAEWLKRFQESNS